MSNKTISSETNFMNEKIPFGTHICLLYDNDQDRYDIIQDFIQNGLKEKQKVLYLFDSENSDQIITEMNKRKVLLPNNQIILKTAEKGYFPKGQFSISDMTESTIQFSEMCQKEGYDGSRGSGEMSWVIKKLKDSSELMRYESNLSKAIKNTKYIALCQYDTRKFNTATIMDALKTHQILALKGKFVKNPFFIEPEIFLKSMKNHALN
jgi:hypothetical protein